MRKFIFILSLTIIAALSGCGNATDMEIINEITETTSEYETVNAPPLEESESVYHPLEEPEELETHPTIVPPIQEISPFGRQVAIEFLSSFPSIFQSTFGWRDSRTGNFYALNNAGEWVSINDLPPADIPVVFQGGIRDNIPGIEWYTDTWGIFFDENFYDINGNLITDVLFIRESDRESAVGGHLAYNFQLFDLNGDGIPEIVIDFYLRGTFLPQNENDRGWGFQFRHPFVLYEFIDGAYREAGIMPSLSHSSAGYQASLPPISINQYGEIFIFAADGHAEERLYQLEFKETGIELTRINDDDAVSWWFDNYSRHAEFHPLIGLQNEIHELLSSRLNSVPNA